MAFAEISEENIKDLLSTKDSKETKRAVKRGVKLLRDYLTNKGVSSDFQNFAKCELNEHLRTFYASARKKDGDMMKTNSLTSLKYGISKYLKDTLEIDIKNDSEFSTSNTVYSAVLTHLKKKGLGSVDHKPAICPEDLFKIYDPSNVALNPNTPTGLLNKTWFDVMTFLCRRGRENLRDMTRDTFSVHVDGSGRRFVMQVQDENDKNHTVKDNPNDTIGEGRMYEKVGSSMCPVASFTKYLSKLHPDNTALWQQPRDTYHCSDEVWYTKTPLGKITLSSMVSNISKLSKLSMIYTNHSIRATAITEMDEAGIDTRHIMRVSGHKSESSIKHYTQRLSEKKKREISDCLSETLMKASDSKACKAETTSNLQSTSTATSTVMNTEQQPDVSDLDFLFDNNDLQALFDNSFEIQNENVLNQEPVAVNSSALDQNMCSPNNNISALNDNMVPIQNNQSNRSAVQNVSNNIAQSIPVQFNSLPEATNRNIMPNIANHNCTVNFHFHLK